MIFPVETKNNIVTQKFKPGIHEGVDIRTYDFERDKLLPIVLCEEAEFLRQGVDGYGNDFIVFKGLESGLILRYVHIDITEDFKKDTVYDCGSKIGYSKIGGNSKQHHLHFSVSRLDDMKTFVDPLPVFVIHNVEYKCL